MLLLNYPIKKASRSFSHKQQKSPLLELAICRQFFGEREWSSFGFLSIFPMDLLDEKTNRIKSNLLFKVECLEKVANMKNSSCMN